MNYVTDCINNFFNFLEVSLPHLESTTNVHVAFKINAVVVHLLDVVSYLGFWQQVIEYLTAVA